MIKIFKRQINNKDYEIRIFNFEDNTFTLYFQDKTLGFIYSNSTLTIKQLGYNSIEQCFKEIKRRGLLGNEVDFEEQKESEIKGFLNLAVERISRNLNYEDIIIRLCYGYGLSKDKVKKDIMNLLNLSINNELF